MNEASARWTANQTDARVDRQQHLHSSPFVRPLAKLRRLHLGIEFGTASFCARGRDRDTCGISWTAELGRQESPPRDPTARLDCAELGWRACRINIVICQTAVCCRNRMVGVGSEESHQTILPAGLQHTPPGVYGRYLHSVNKTNRP